MQRYKGISYKKQTNKWLAQIVIRHEKLNSKIKHLGYYDTEDDAARAYNYAANLLGMKTNNIDGDIDNSIKEKIENQLYVELFIKYLKEYNIN